MINRLRFAGDTSFNYVVINNTKENDMKSKKTYTTTNNARRAGVAAGIPTERVALTVHKNGDEVRFGWKEIPIAAKAKEKATVTTLAKVKGAPKVEREENNGVKRPKAGGVCAAVWDWLDANPAASVAEAKAAAPAHGWNPNNVSCEYYARRKFLGISRTT
jgi:hypothetical protein